ncbi:LysR family transcriptional regulator [Pectinatus frisingensis]|uniref:LysR family transcriptional regulator n=1 Tax=Pectinatus frisingensis TaxID=865 RepID=UPI0018C6D720|nr:LysR family transcriptional regulator [Pectinatus frisingensis]
MDILQLKYFREVAQSESMTKAAEKLHIAQPSLSKTILRLEKGLGVVLFDRVGKRIKLNDYGKLFLKRVERVFNELDAGQRELADLAGIGQEHVTLGASSSRFLPNLLNEFLVGHPQVNFRLRHFARQAEMQEQLLNGQIDLSIFFLPVIHPQIHSEPLIDEEIFLAVPPKHHLAGRKSIQLREAAAESFISYTADSELWDITHNFCRQAGFEPGIVFEIESLEAIATLVNAGLGVTFLPAYWRQSDISHLPVQLHIENPVCQRTIWLSWIKGRYMSPITNTFKNFVIRYFSR